MWIGFAIVLMMNGELTTGAGSFSTEAECKQRNEKIIADAKAHKGVFAYHLECVEADDKFMTIKQPEPVKPAGSTEPGPTTNGA